MNLAALVVGFVLGGVCTFIGLCYLLGWARKNGLLFINEDLQGCIIIRPKARPIIDLEEHL